MPSSAARVREAAPKASTGSDPDRGSDPVVFFATSELFATSFASFSDVSSGASRVPSAAASFSFIASASARRASSTAFSSARCFRRTARATSFSATSAARSSACARSRARTSALSSKRSFFALATGRRTNSSAGPEEAAGPEEEEAGGSVSAAAAAAAADPPRVSSPLARRGAYSCALAAIAELIFVAPSLSVCFACVAAFSAELLKLSSHDIPAGVGSDIATTARGAPRREGVTRPPPRARPLGVRRRARPRGRRNPITTRPAARC